MARLRSTIARTFNQTTLIVLYLLGTVLFVVLGWRLQHKAFPPPAASGQIFVAVFVQHPSAQVDLIAYINPNQPSEDQLAVRARSGNPGNGLVIIQCPSNPHSTFPQTNAVLTSAAAPPTQIESQQNVIEEPDLSLSRATSRFSLGCFQQVPPGTYNIANVTLPALGTDQAIAAVRTFPILYVDKKILVQIFPGAQCPAPVSSPATTSPTDSASPSTTASSSGSTITSVSPSATQSVPVVNASGSSAAAPASATASPSITGNPDCFVKQPAGSSFSEYYIPKTLRTEENLRQINWKGYTYETEFPNPVSQSSDDIRWDGSSGLSPSVTVADPTNEREVSQDSFISGILYGVAGGTAVSFIDHVVQACEKRRAWKRNSKADPDLGRNSIMIIEPAADDGSHYLRFVNGDNGQDQVRARQAQRIRSLPPGLKGSRSYERRSQQTEKAKRLIKRWQANSRRAP